MCKGKVFCHVPWADQAETWQVFSSPGDMTTYMFWTYWPQPPGGGGQGVVLEVREAYPVRFWVNFTKGKL